MATVDLTAKTFQETIEKDGIVFVDYWASWCAPCRVFAPIYHKASEAHPDITWAKVDTQAEREIASGMQIEAIPTIMAFRDGILVFAQSGAMPGKALERLVEEVRKLDMDDVRKKVAEHEHGHSHGPGEEHDHGHGHGGNGAGGDTH